MARQPNNFITADYWWLSSGRCLYVAERYNENSDFVYCLSWFAAGQLHVYAPYVFAESILESCLSEFSAVKTR